VGRRDKHGIRRPTFPGADLVIVEPRHIFLRIRKQICEVMRAEMVDLVVTVSGQHRVIRRDETEQAPVEEDRTSEVEVRLAQRGKEGLCLALCIERRVDSPRFVPEGVGMKRKNLEDEKGERSAEQPRARREQAESWYEQAGRQWRYVEEVADLAKRHRMKHGDGEDPGNGEHLLPSSESERLKEPDGYQEDGQHSESRCVPQIDPERLTRGLVPSFEKQDSGLPKDSLDPGQLGESALEHLAESDEREKTRCGGCKEQKAQAWESSPQTPVSLGSQADEGRQQGDSPKHCVGVLDQSGRRPEQDEPDPPDTAGVRNELMGPEKQEEQEQPRQDVVTEKRSVGEEKEARDRREERHQGVRVPAVEVNEDDENTSEVAPVENRKEAVVRPNVERVKAEGLFQRLGWYEQPSKERATTSDVSVDLAQSETGVADGVVAVVVVDLDDGCGQSKPTQEYGKSDSCTEIKPAVRRRPHVLPHVTSFAVSILIDERVSAE